MFVKYMFVYIGTAHISIIGFNWFIYVREWRVCAIESLIYTLIEVTAHNKTAAKCARERVTSTVVQTTLYESYRRNVNPKTMATMLFASSFPGNQLPLLAGASALEYVQPYFPTRGLRRTRVGGTAFPDAINCALQVLRAADKNPFVFCW